MNNIGVLYRDGLGVSQNRKIACLLFLRIHMTGVGGEETVMHANGNLRRSIATLADSERQEALCYTLDYVSAYIESNGTEKKTAKEIRHSANTKRIRDFSWWAPGEVGEFERPAGT